MNPQPEEPFRPAACFGLFLLSLMVLMYEVLLTRVFSVTMWYHFAFMAISLAMFGITAGAVFVFLRPRLFPAGTALVRMSRFSFFASAAVIGCFLVYLRIPFDLTPSLRNFVTLAGIFALAAMPIFFAGVATTLALTRFPRRVGALYAFDLIGAGLGCLAVSPALRWTDGPTAVIAVAMFGFGAAACFAHAAGRRGLTAGSIAAALAVAAFAVVNGAMIQQGRPLLPLRWIKGMEMGRPLFESWNAISRVTVTGDPDHTRSPEFWGRSPSFTDIPQIHELSIAIDSSAGTVLTEYNGDPSTVDFLKYDMINFVHWLRENARVLVVGVGGGRDILSALAFHQASTTGVEINPDIIDLLRSDYADFTGRLAGDPRVTLVNDEARSYIARQEGRYDIIQISFIDTWAATVAGAFALSENSLYTVEACRTYLEHLSENGILSISRWYYSAMPSEMRRLLAVAAQALREMGVEHPRDHLAVLHVRELEEKDDPSGEIGTLLVFRSPISGEDRGRLREVAASLDYDLMLSPDSAADPVLGEIAEAADLDGFARTQEFDISPSRDDKPFFFHMLRFRDIWNSKLKVFRLYDTNIRAIYVLGSLLIIVTGLTALAIVGPLLLFARRGTRRGAGPYLIYFGAIGLGFMLVEISQMQRLMIFLGHPVYGLVVVLFTLLLAGGLGSALTNIVPAGRERSAGIAVLAGMMAILVFAGWAAPEIARSFAASSTPARIAVSAALLSLMGLGMGTAFPLGMRLASLANKENTPWYWGINGAASVCASTLVVAISLAFGISASYWTGVFAYAAALGAFAAAARQMK